MVCFVGSNYRALLVRPQNFQEIAKAHLDHCERRGSSCRPSSEDEVQCANCIRLRKECIPGIQQSNTNSDMRQSNTCILPNIQQPNTAILEDDGLGFMDQIYLQQLNPMDDPWGPYGDFDLQQSNSVADNSLQSVWNSDFNMSTGWSPPSPFVPGRPRSVASFSSAGSHNVSPWA